VNSSFYIFGWDGTNFTEETRVLYTDVNGIDSTADFGREVFIDSDSIIIGCPKQNEWKGSVVVYNYDGTTMSTPSIINNPRNISGQFGWSIYKIDQRVLIGVPYIISQGGSANAGEMHLFDFREPPGEFYNYIVFLIIKQKKMGDGKYYHPSFFSEATLL
jgi:hypothetical protein